MNSSWPKRIHREYYYKRGTEQTMKKKQLCSFYGDMFLKGLSEYCIGCQKQHDFTRTFGTKSCSPFLWLQRPHMSLHSLEMELLCNIQKGDLKRSERNIWNTFANMLSSSFRGKKNPTEKWHLRWRRRKHRKSTSKKVIYLWLQLVLFTDFQNYLSSLKFTSTYP